MNFNSKSLVSVFVAAMVLMAALSGAALADPSTTTESDVESGDHLYLDSSSDEVEKLKFDVTGSNTTTMTVNVTDTAETSSETDTIVYSITDADAALSENTTSGVWTANLSHADISNEAERNVSESHTLELMIEHEHDDDSDGVQEYNTTTFNVTAEIVSTSDERTVAFDENAPDGVGPSLTILEEASDGFLGFGAEDHASYEASNNVPHGQYGYNNTTFVMSGATADAFDDAAGNASSSDPVLGQTVFVNGELVPVYADSAGDIHENGSYAVYDSSASELTVEFGEERSDAYATDVDVVNNNPLSEAGFRETMDLYGLGTTLDLVVPDLI